MILLIIIDITITLSLLEEILFIIKVEIFLTITEIIIIFILLEEILLTVKKITLIISLLKGTFYIIIKEITVNPSF